MNSTTQSLDAAPPVPTPQVAARAHAFATFAAVAAMCGAALAYALTTIAALCNYGLRELAWDQYKMYGAFYLSRPLPDSVLQLENGHRPVLPALLRVAEIHFWHANQLAQLIVGGSFAVLTALLLAGLCARARDWSAPLRATGVFVGVIGVLWMANARMLLHGNELVHVYTVTLCVTLGTLCIWRARGEHPVRWALLATACAGVSMFSFGSGVAAFPALIVIATMLRTRWRVQAILGVALVALLYLYVFVLPGREGVRDMLVFRPLDSLTLVARWLASPWVNAWLGFGGAPLQPWLVENLAARHPHSLLLGSARVMHDLGLGWEGFLPTLIGGASLLALAWYVLRRLKRWERPSLVEAVACALMLFGAATAVLIGIGRLEMLTTAPGQTFADRYLAWPSLYWAGLCVLGLAALARSKRRGLHYAAAAAGLLLAVVLFENQRGWIGWGATVARINERAAAAARSGVWDGDVLPDDDSADRSETLHTLDLMRAQNLGMFTEPSWRLLDTALPGPFAETREYAPLLRVVRTFDDSSSGLPAAQLEGWFRNAHGAPKQRWPLLFVDAQDRVVGFAQFSFIGPNVHALRVNVPVKKGFDGYIRDYRSDATYRLVTRDPAATGYTVLATIADTRQID